MSSIDPFDGAFEPPEAPKKRADVIEFPEENIPFLVQVSISDLCILIFS